MSDNAPHDLEQNAGSDSSRKLSAANRNQNGADKVRTSGKASPQKETPSARISGSKPAYSGALSAGADKEVRGSNLLNELAGETIKDHIDILLERVESQKSDKPSDDNNDDYEYEYSRGGSAAEQESPAKDPLKSEIIVEEEYSTDDLTSLSASRRPGFEASSSLRTYSTSPATTKTNLKATLSQVANPRSPAAIFLDKRSHLILPICLCLVASVSLYFLVHRFERDSYFERGSKLLAAGKAHGALPLFQKVLKFDPGDMRAARAAGQACSHMKNWDMAAKYYALAIADRPGDPDIVDEYAKVAMHQGRYQAAVDAYNKMLSMQKDKPTSKQLHSRAIALAKLGRWNAALVDYAVLLNRDSQDDDALAGMAFCKAKMGRFDEATENLNTVLNRSPKHIQARLLRGECYLYDKDYANASKDFNLVLLNNPDNLDGQLHMASLEVALGKKAEALNRLNSIVAKHADSLVAHKALGELLLSMKKYDSALAEFQKVCSIDRSNVNLYSRVWSAQDLIHKHKCPEALGALTDLIRVHPDFGHLYAIRSQAHAGVQNYTAAIADCTTALKYSPNNPDALLFRARYHAFAGNTLSAMRDYQAALQVSPGSVASYIELANLEMTMQKYSSAYKHFTTASSIDRSNQEAKAGSNRARVAMRTQSSSSRSYTASAPARSSLSKKELAEIAEAPAKDLIPRIYEALKSGRLDYVNAAAMRAITLDPRAPEPRQYILIALIRQERLDLAEAHLMALQKMGKARDRDLFSLVKAYTNQGQSQNSSRLLEEYLKTHPGDAYTIEMLADAYAQSGYVDKGIGLCDEAAKTANPSDASRLRKCSARLKESKIAPELKIIKPVAPPKDYQSEG
ncbi:MAG: tetratricopeptide repeat protein [Cyanobacteria bacterium]|nr:tetratricopeptide repeat protein [Cyanobacteriota bacterium]